MSLKTFQSHMTSVTAFPVAKLRIGVRDSSDEHTETLLLEKARLAARRGRIDTEFRRAALSDLAMLEITTDPHTDSNVWGETLHLADRCGLTVYDAAYLELSAPPPPSRDA
jgi:hypothetical protein